jgi:acyl carrier protein
MTEKAVVLEAVQEIVEEVLACEPGEAASSAGFLTDLGGESIDLLDLSFRCEKRFGVKLRLESLLSAELTETSEGGTLTHESLRMLRERFPFLDFTRLPDAATRLQLDRLLTVEAIADFVCLALATQEGQISASPA